MQNRQKIAFMYIKTTSSITLLTGDLKNIEDFGNSFNSLDKKSYNLRKEIFPNTLFLKKMCTQVHFII